MTWVFDTFPKVTNVCPGPVETNFNVSSFGEEGAAKVFGGPRYYERLSAEEVAEAVLGAVNVAANVQVVNLHICLVGRLSRNLLWKVEFMFMNATRESLKASGFDVLKYCPGGRSCCDSEWLLQEKLMYVYCTGT